MLGYICVDYSCFDLREELQIGWECIGSLRVGRVVFAVACIVVFSLGTSAIAYDPNAFPGHGNRTASGGEVTEQLEPIKTISAARASEMALSVILCKFWLKNG